MPINMQVKITELENGLQITETIGSNIVNRYLTSYAFPFIRSTNESEETYQVVDAVGEIYNLPALPSEFILININTQTYIPSDGSELIEFSNFLKPFRKNELEDKVISIGSVTASTSIVNVGLDPSGINSVFINLNLRQKFVSDSFNFTPVTTGIKVLIIYAKDDPQIFYLAEGVESSEAVEPIYTGLFVARLIISATGVVIETEESGNKYKADDAWRQFTLGATPLIISTAIYKSSSFEFLTTEVAPVFGGIITKKTKNVWDGKRFYLKNSSDKPVALNPTVIPVVGDANAFTLDKVYVMKPFSDAVIWIKNGALEMMAIGGGANKTSEVENDSSVTGATAKDSLETLHGEIDTEIVNRALAVTNLQGQINTNNNAIADLNAGKIEITTTTSITTNTVGTVSGKGQHYRTVFIKNGVNAINITCEVSSNANFEAIYYKTGSATITFVAGAGATLIQVDADNKLNGAIGSTAVLTRDGNNFYLRISNA